MVWFKLSRALGVVLAIGCRSGAVHAAAFEPWFESARAKLSATFYDFTMNPNAAELDEGLLLEVRRLDALITDPVAQLNFRNLLTKIYIVPATGHLTTYRARFGRTPTEAYPYYHAIEISPAAARSVAGRVFLLEALHLGFDRVTEFGRRAVPGVSWTGVLGWRSRRAGIEFLVRYVSSPHRRALMDQIVARGQRGVHDQQLKFYYRLAAAEGESAAPVFAELMGPAYRDRIACEMGLWRRYDPVRDRERLLGR